MIGHINETIGPTKLPEPHSLNYNYYNSIQLQKRYTSGLKTPTQFKVISTFSEIKILKQD